MNGKWYFAYQLQLVPENTISIKKRKPVDAVFVNPAGPPQFQPLRPRGRIDVQAEDIKKTGGYNLRPSHCWGRLCNHRIFV